MDHNEIQNVSIWSKVHSVTCKITIMIYFPFRNFSYFCNFFFIQDVLIQKNDLKIGAVLSIMPSQWQSHRAQKSQIQQNNFLIKL